MPYTITPNMNLILPTPGQEPGPQYAYDQNQSGTITDAHNHSLGSGVQITPAGMNISTNLNFLGNSPYNVSSVIFSMPAANATLTTLYTNAQSGGGITDLFFNDGAGNVIALTKAGLVNATIASLPGESYSAGTFTWKQGNGSTTPANFDIGSVVIRPTNPATTFGVILGPPSAISSEYNVQLPIVPSNDSFMQLNTDGSMVATIPVTAGITSANLSPSIVNALASSGDIKMSGAVSTPSGWLACDGTSYLIATWPALAAALFDSGTGFYAYGSIDAGATSFNVPDMRGMFPRGTDSSGVNDPDFASRTATTGGNSAGNIGSLQPYQIQAHVHSKTVLFAGGTGGNPAWAAANTPTGSANTDSTGGNQTNPVNVYVNFYIKT